MRGTIADPTVLASLQSTTSGGALELAYDDPNRTFVVHTKSADGTSLVEHGAAIPCHDQRSLALQLGGLTMRPWIRARSSR